MKKQCLWIGAILIFWALVNIASGHFGWALREGFSGLVIQIFFGYCALILVAQAFSAMAVIGSTAVEMSKRKKVTAREVAK
jgi:hypothetical protein